MKRSSSALPRVFRRDCVVCDDTPLTCPTCPSGQTCIQVSETCDNCASRQCVPDAESGAASTASIGSSGPNVGAIAGGVVGGIVLMCVAMYLLWRFYLKPRRQREQELYEKSMSQYAGSVAGSQATRSSMATVNTRSSNVIQIAFIPGVTDRSDGQYTPPVPSLPSRIQLSPYTDTRGDHYFMPGDLRDSTYSGFTDDGASTIGRRSIAPSIAPSLLRQSVASTIYHEIHNTPAQAIHRARPNVVTVRSAGGTTSPLPPVPAVPKIDHEKFGPQKAQSTTTTNTVSGLETVSEAPVPSITVTSDSASEGGLSTVSGANLQSAIEQAARRASRQPTHGGFGSVISREPSPFSDEHCLSETSSVAASPK